MRRGSGLLSEETAEGSTASLRHTSTDHHMVILEKPCTGFIFNFPYFNNHLSSYSPVLEHPSSLPFLHALLPALAFLFFAPVHFRGRHKAENIPSLG